MGSSRSGKAFRLLSVLAGVGALLLLMLYMGGVFDTGKIRPASKEVVARDFQPRQTATASVETITEFYESVGTVRPKTETRVDSQVMAKILEILVRPGAHVEAGQILVRLDGREYEAKLEQAVQALSSARSRRQQVDQTGIAAKAELERAEAAFNRTRAYLEGKAATAQDMEQAEAAFRQATARFRQAEEAKKEADAGIRRAEKAVEEARIGLGHTRIAAPEASEVVRRLAEPGDLATPGKPLLLLQTRGKLRLEALIPESLIRKIRVGTTLDVRIDALDRMVSGTVEEVVPSANPMTRTILAKVSLPEEEDIFPGMFGRLLLPVKETTAVLMPKKALRRIGQLEVVTAEVGGRWQRIFVTTGKVVGDKVEVLSGLKGGEKLALEGDHAG
ncbi:MAG: efflux RND transporter periplasmic adaptor subunit [Desulfobacteraceae bacterium]|nr:MAG: efflux RND transporter periplasmic adaptor subunit [Desulfobacteraceae bacterium]